MTRLMKARLGSSALLLPLLASCHATSAPTVPRAPQEPKAVVAPAEPSVAKAQEAPFAAPELGAPAQQFLVHAESQELVLRSMTSETQRVLVPHADVALYQPELELVWFRDQDRFGVVDLRKHDAPVTTIARGMPSEDQLRIARGKERVNNNDGCDVAFVSFEWSASPVLQAFLTEAPELQIENGAWLARERERPVRSAGVDHGLSGRPIRLPKQATTCDRPNVCGATGPFGGSTKQLVLVQEELGGDCIERACLLHDPSTGLFATPPKAEKWGSARATSRGSCGPYLFDQSRTVFLVGHRLCTLDQGCKELGGEALGWLLPGESVGVPGSSEAPE